MSMSNPSYPINEIFTTIQGEASYCGTPSVFIRMQGCSVGCSWCDTKHTWNMKANTQVAFSEVIKKDRDKNTWASASMLEIVQFIVYTYPRITHVVITGGEPAMYDLRPLCKFLEIRGYKIQIETSGTEPLGVTRRTWVTVSPKIDMPGGKLVLPESILRADEIKMPIGRSRDIEKLKEFLSMYKIKANTKIWLQPLSQSKLATKICIEEALANNWNLSVQVHKFLDIK